MSENFLKNPERRYHKRLDVDLQVSLNIDGQTINASASNISCGGVFLPTRQTGLAEKKLAEKVAVEMLLSLPDSDRPVKVVGEVARVGYSGDSETDEVGVALRFNGLPDDNILAIDKFIKTRLH